VRLGRAFGPGSGSQCFPLRVFGPHSGSGFSLGAFRGASDQSMRSTCNGSPLHTWILLPGRRDKQPAVSTHRITVGRFLGIRKRQCSQASQGDVNRITSKHPR